jgi:hypothetical protein
MAVPAAPSPFPNFTPGGVDDFSDDDDDANNQLGASGDDGDDESEDECAGEGADATGEQPPPAKRRKKKKEIKPLFGKNTSHQKENAKNPELNRAKRAREWAVATWKGLQLRPDIIVDVLNRVIIMLDKEQRAELREMGAMQQEWYLAYRDCVGTLERECFNALHAIDLRACEALSARMMDRTASRLRIDPATGKPRILRSPPLYGGSFNPLTQASNREQGIKSEAKMVVAPRIFPHYGKIVAAADLVLAGRTLHLGVDLDGAAWDLIKMASDLLRQLDHDANIAPLVNRELRVLQLIFDGHGWTSGKGAVRFVLRSPHTLRDHNATRNARDPIFFIGDDKHQYLEMAVQIGGEDSLRAHAYAGLRVTEKRADEMPEHVQSDELFLPLACIEYVAQLKTNSNPQPHPDL